MIAGAILLGSAIMLYTVPLNCDIGYDQADFYRSGYMLLYVEFISFSGIMYEAVIIILQAVVVTIEQRKPNDNMYMITEVALSDLILQQ